MAHVRSPLIFTILLLAFEIPDLVSLKAPEIGFHFEKMSHQ